MLEAILKNAYHRVSSCYCDTSCYSCLRSYSNQRIHDCLDRKKAEKFLNNYVFTVHAYEQEKPVQKNTIKLSGKGKSMKGVSYKDIFSKNLSDAVNAELVLNLIKVFDDNDLLAPTRSEEDFTVNGSIIKYADLIWQSKKLMAFSPDNEDSYEMAKLSDYECIMLDDNIDVGIFVEKLKEKENKI